MSERGIVTVSAVAGISDEDAAKQFPTCKWILGVSGVRATDFKTFSPLLTCGLRETGRIGGIVSAQWITYGDIGASTFHPPMEKITTVFNFLVDLGYELDSKPLRTGPDSWRGFLWTFIRNDK